MNLQLKLFLPTFLLFIGIAAAMHFYWLPNYIAFEEEHQIESEQSFIDVLNTALLPDLLNNDLAKTHSTLDKVLADRQYWQSIKLYDNAERLLYPLEETQLKSRGKLGVMTHDINFEDNKVARFEIWIDFEAAQREELAHLYQLEILLLSILLIAAVLTSLLHDRWIRQPLKQLANVASDIALGHYDSKMEYHSSDEVGRLVAAFNSMHQQIMQREHDLVVSMARNKAVIDNAADGIITIDIKGRIEAFNPAAEKIFGYSSVEIIGQNIKILMPEPYQREHDGYLYNYLSTGVKKIIGIGREAEGLRKDGSTFPLDLAISEVQLDDRRLFIGIIRDITERKKIDKMKSEFISTVSHELRTPLTSIRGALGLVLGKGAKDIPAKLLRLLETANRNSNRLTFMINDILDLEKISAGELDLQFEIVSLSALAKRAIDENDGYAHSHKVKLKLLDNGVENTTVRVDQYRLLQVFANLISNAVKFSKENDSVTIEVKRIDNKVRVSVKDNGPGIAAEFSSRIFQRFAQADSSDTREKGGTGLGLSISQAIINQLGGIIDYKSVIGEGSEFFFELPCCDDGNKTTTPDENPPSILICEDDADLAQILAEILHQNGYSSVIAPNAENARLYLQKGPYQLLLLDLVLPDANGLDFIAELRKTEDTRQLPIIVISGKADEASKNFNGNAITVADWLQKPIDFERLSSAMSNLIEHDQRSRILHVEDNLDVIEVAQALLEGEVNYDYATTLSEALKKLAEHTYNLVIIDISLPDGSGLELLAHIERGCPVVIFSGQESSAEISKKVDATLTKSISSNDELITTVKRLLKQTN
ncbi:MAG: response regulator [Cycloclasticus sp.]|nr:response regulator [Cycloclasticus sp.]